MFAKQEQDILTPEQSISPLVEQIITEKLSIGPGSGRECQTRDKLEECGLLEAYLKALKEDLQQFADHYDQLGIGEKTNSFTIREQIAQVNASFNPDPNNQEDDQGIFGLQTSVDRFLEEHGHCLTDVLSRRGQGYLRTTLLEQAAKEWIKARTGGAKDNLSEMKTTDPLEIGNGGGAGLHSYPRRSTYE